MTVECSKIEITTRLGAGGSEMQQLIHDYILKHIVRPRTLDTGVLN